GPANDDRVITSITSHTGLVAKVVYYADRGMALRDLAGLAALPFVHLHKNIPGGGQPMIDTKREWKDKNNLVRDARQKQWQPDTE
ncbi:hypothetical protein LXA00_18105, partial [Erwinia amylovora]|uniref:hypothetical protein n=1 Tax=Erwinia amylovora TaxID=552 RepID=UPI0020BDB7B5